MTDQDRIDDLLDRWEQARADGSGAVLDDFVREHGAGLPADVVARFRESAARLAVMDRRVDALVGGPPGEAGRGDDPGFALFPGVEPVDGYRLDVRLGAGGFGQVWRAAGPGGKRVALKFVPLARKVGESELRSLDLVKDLNHPHLLAIHGHWQRNGYLIVAAELADRTLRDRLDEAVRGGLPGVPREELLGYFAGAAKGLDFLNAPRSDGAAGIQHRDVKPENVLLVGGEAKVGDFGLARALEGARADHSGSMSVRYAAPEFFDGRTSPRSDQYSLAVAWCHLRGGQLPFAGDTWAELRDGHLHREPDLSMLPPEERPAVARALAKQPEARWASCGEFVEQLRWAAPGRPTPSPSRRRWPLAAVAAVVCAGLIAAVLAGRADRTGQPNAPEPPAAAPVPPPRPAGPTTLAVLDFDNTGREPSLDGFRQGFRDMLVTDLAKLKAVRVVERARLQAVLDEQKLAAGGFIDPTTAARVGRGLAADTLLTGSFLIEGERVRVDVRAVVVETGEVLFTASAAGTKGNLFGLQTDLAGRVIAGLAVPVAADERGALAAPQTTDFEAFRLYGDALAASRAADARRAEELFRRALARDPTYAAAARELAGVEAAAMVRLADAERDRLARLGEIGRALADHRERLRAIVERGEPTPEYFAALVALSAHAGLLADADRERRLLRLYWDRFALAVPVERAAEVGGAVARLVAADGRIFQEQLDSGDYHILIEGLTTAEKQYLKPAARADLRWPKYAAIWPFDPDARVAFGVVRDSKRQGVAVGPEYFERTLPRFPHDYLKHLLDARDDRGRPTADAVGLWAGVVRYYAPVKTPAAANLNDIQTRMSERLSATDPAEWPPAVLAEAVAGLEAVATAAADPEARRRADEALVSYVRQAKLNAGRDDGPPPAKATPVKFAALELRGPRLEFVFDVPKLGGGRLLTAQSYLEKEFADAARGLTAAHALNLRLAGKLAEKAPATLFAEPRRAEPKTRAAAIGFQKGSAEHRGFGLDGDREVGIADALEKALAGWPTDESGAGDLVVVSGRERIDIPAGVLAAVRKRPAGRPAIHFVGEHRPAGVADLVRASGGAAVVLEEGDLLQVEPRRWDVGKP